MDVGEDRVRCSSSVFRMSKDKKEGYGNDNIGAPSEDHFLTILDCDETP